MCTYLDIYVHVFMFILMIIHMCTHAYVSVYSMSAYRYRSYRQYFWQATRTWSLYEGEPCVDPSLRLIITSIPVRSYMYVGTHVLVREDLSPPDAGMASSLLALARPACRKIRWRILSTNFHATVATTHFEVTGSTPHPRPGLAPVSARPALGLGLNL